MKSQSFSLVFDYRGQIIDNCAFISSQDDTISLTTVKEPSGDWKAIALRWNDDDRDALLSSEPCDSIQKALESLHAKSAEATAVYIKTNGYGHLPGSNKDDDLSDDDTASVVSERSTATSTAISTWESSDEEVITLASSSPTAGQVSTKGSKNSKKSRKRGSKAHQTSKYESGTSEDELADGTPTPQISASPVRHMGNRPISCRPLPPSGWTGPPPPPPPAYRGPGIMAGGQPHPPLCNPGPSGPPAQVGHLPPPPPPPPPGFRPMHPKQTPRLYDVRITINWLHHSEQRIFESTKASIRALQDTALAYVRGHMTAFDKVTPVDHLPNKVWNLRANIRQAVFGNEAYDISGYRGDDLTRLFNVLGKNDIPRFEIEVDYARPAGMIPVVQVNTPPKQ